MDPTYLRLLWTKSSNYLQMDGSKYVMDHGDKLLSYQQNLIKNMYCRLTNAFGKCVYCIKDLTQSQSPSNTLFNGVMMLAPLLQLSTFKCGLLPSTHVKGIIK